MSPDLGESPLSTRRGFLRIGGAILAGGLASMVPATGVRAESSAAGDSVTTTYKGHSPWGFDQWAYVPFEVPPGVSRISVSRTFDGFTIIPGVIRNVLDIGIFDPGGWGPGAEDGFRGWSGGAREAFTLSATTATPGYLAGPIDPGTWAVALGPIVVNPFGMNWQVDVTLEFGPAGLPFQPEPAPDRATGRGAAWYRGDMHLHTIYSDGKRTPEQLVYDAQESGLDFIGSTEHNTGSANRIWGRYANDDLLIIPGEEVTTRHGHWLAIGLPFDRWVDWRYAPNGEHFAGYAASVRAFGGIVVAAHPNSPGAGATWGFGYAHVDGIEVWNGPWTIDDNGAVQAWDGLLRSGRRVAAVGNSDAHNPADTVGRPQTVVFASELSRTAIVAAVRAGRSYLAESAKVTLELTATAGDIEAGPGQSLGVDDNTDVTVTAKVSGVPSAKLTLHTKTGVVATVSVNGSGTASWQTRGAAAGFVRAEVRRPIPTLTTLNTMVALSNPVWLA